VKVASTVPRGGKCREAPTYLDYSILPARGWQDTLLYHLYEHHSDQRRPYAMQHQNPTEPDITRHFSQISPSRTLKLRQAAAVHILKACGLYEVYETICSPILRMNRPELVTSPVTNWGGGCHQMAPNGTNSRSHQQLVTSPVTNNGPLTRKIRFRTAFPPIVTPLSPILQLVTKKGIDDKFGRGRRYSSPRFLLEPAAAG
jgi:hypothetical protein